MSWTMKEGAHLHLGLLKAWELWFQGKDIKGDGDFVWGLSLIWWGRIAVAAGFLGGLIIILDIIGEDRLKNFGLKRWRAWDEPGPTVLDWLADLAPLVILPGIFLAILWLEISLSSNPLFRDVGAALASAIAAYLALTVISLFLYKVLAENKGMKYARLFALLMLVVSAHFTLLTS